MQASRCLFHDFHDLTHFLHHIFLNKCFSLQREAHFSKNDFESFRSKKSLFWPPNGFKNIMFCHFCLLLLLCCSFGSLCARSMPPSKTACSSTPVQLSPPSPVCKNDGMHSTCNFVNLVCDLLISFSSYCPSFCLKDCFPPSLGAWLKNCTNAESCQHDLLRPSNRTDYTPFWAVYANWNLQNR